MLKQSQTTYSVCYKRLNHISSHHLKVHDNLKYLRHIFYSIRRYNEQSSFGLFKRAHCGCLKHFLTIGTYTHAHS